MHKALFPAPYHTYDVFMNILHVVYTPSISILLFLYPNHSITIYLKQYRHSTLLILSYHNAFKLSPEIYIIYIVSVLHFNLQKLLTFQM